MGGLGLTPILLSALVRAARGQEVCSDWVLGEGLSGLRKGCGGFKLDSDSPERMGEGIKGPRGVIRLGIWGGPLGAGGRLWGVQS